MVTRSGGPGAPREPARRSSLRQERSQRSRAELVAAADRLWSEQGFDATKVSDVCEAAGVSKGLFYFYFGSKEDLLVEFVLDDADQAAAAMHRAIEADAPVEAVLQKGVAVLVRRAQKRPRHLLARGIAEWFAAVERHAAISTGHTALSDSMGAVFAHGQSRGEIRDDIDPAEAGDLLAWSLLRSELDWATSPNRQPALLKRLWTRVELVLGGTAASGPRRRR
ncbi:MAG: TetR/AcrR family transcriptional regulator [Acidimicrobiales bacterium]